MSTPWTAGTDRTSGRDRCPGDWGGKTIDNCTTVGLRLVREIQDRLANARGVFGEVIPLVVFGYDRREVGYRKRVNHKVSPVQTPPLKKCVHVSVCVCCACTHT